MNTDSKSLVLFGAGIAFFIYIVVKTLLARVPRDERTMAAHRRIADAKRRARDRSATNQVRAAALREAATVALEELRRPLLAASYARRAERLAPEGPVNAGLLSATLRRGAKFQALERMLWRDLADQTDPHSAAYEATFQELVALYDGPLQRGEIAQALRHMRAAARLTGTSLR